MNCFQYCLSKESYNEMNTIGDNKNIVIKDDMSRTDVKQNVVVIETVVETKVNNSNEVKEVVIETVVETKVNNSNEVKEVVIENVEETKEVNEEVDNELDLVIIDNRVTLTHPIIYNDSYISQ